MRLDEHPEICQKSLTLCTPHLRTNRTRLISRTPTELINFMKSIGADILVVFTLLVGFRMGIKVMLTSMVHDFLPFKRSDSLNRFKFISNGAVERVVREKEWDAKQHVSHSVLVLSPEHVLTHCTGYCGLGRVQR